MRKTMVGWMTASVLVVSASTAFAQQGSNTAARCAGTSNTGSSSRDQTFCFEPEAVHGDLDGVTGQPVRTLRPLHGMSLLRLRAHFVPEMLKSAESL